MSQKMILMGCGGHARSLVDAIEAAGEYTVAGFVVSNGSATDATYRDYGVLGTDRDLPAIFESGVTAAAVAVGYLGAGQVRQQLAAQLKEIGFSLPAIIDPTAVVATDALIGEGAFVGKRAVVNAAATVGDCAIVNTGAIVEHDCAVGDFSHVAVGAVLCGHVTVEQGALVGAGATVLQGCVIGAGARVGAGATVLADVPADTTAVGVVKG